MRNNRAIFCHLPPPISVRDNLSPTDYHTYYSLILYIYTANSQPTIQFSPTGRPLPPSSYTHKYTLSHGAIKMLKWVLLFFILSIVAGVLGFTGIAVSAASIAKILFYIFLVVFVVSLVLHFMKGSRM